MARAQLSLLIASAAVFLGHAAVVESAPSRTAVLADLEINRPIEGDAVVFGADLRLGPEASVSGDAIAVGGDVIVADGAVVGRHVVAMLGTAEVAQAARVGGRVLAFASLATLARGDTVEPRLARVDLGLRLLASGGWLLVTTGLAFLFPARMRYGAWALPALGFRVPALGTLVALTIVASLVAVLGLGPALGVPLVAALMTVFFAAKCVGLTVVGCTLGNAVLTRWLHHPLPISLEVFVGVLALLALRFLPAVGESLWTVVALVALGASIATFGSARPVPAVGVRP
ncbi:MAG TPA: hypothetical protein VLT81_08045 [Chondromyces sp.]|nr:hypothetical protein [Chondromyces sp.]